MNRLLEGFPWWPPGWYRSRRNRRGGGPVRAEGKDGAGRSESQMADRSKINAHIYDAYRTQIEHEGHLIGMRNGWLVGGQAFLFAAYSATLEVQDRGVQRSFSSAANELFDELPALGIVLAVLVSIAVNAALALLLKLRREFENLDECPDRYPSIIPGLLGCSGTVSQERSPFYSLYHGSRYSFSGRRSCAGHPEMNFASRVNCCQVLSVSWRKVNACPSPGAAAHAASTGR